MNGTPQLRHMITQLEKSKQLIPQNPVPKIQRVAHHLRDRKHFARHYSPTFVSFGPIHHGAKNLQLGEKYKLMWAARYLERTRQDAEILYQKIASNIKQLKERFAEDVIDGFPDDEKLTCMLLVDGCALLQILEEGKLVDLEEMTLNLKVDQLVFVWQDVLLLENQLPYEVLKLLSGHENEAKLLKSMEEYLGYHELTAREPIQEVKDQVSALAEAEGFNSVDITNEDALQGEHIIDMPKEEETLQREQRVETPHAPPKTPVHLLDQLRRSIVEDPPKNHQHQQKYQTSYMIICGNITELKAAGISVSFRKSKRIRDISLSQGWLWSELNLPSITVDDTSAPTFLNLTAYEMCPDFKNGYEICSFLALMYSLIDHPDDVKELKSARVILSALSSDEEVAKLFNDLGTNLDFNPDTYSRVRFQIENHYRNKCRTWIARGYHTYFSSPGTIIAFYAALVALILTFIQTWYAVKK